MPLGNAGVSFREMAKKAPRLSLDFRRASKDFHMKARLRLECMFLIEKFIFS